MATDTPKTTADPEPGHWHPRTICRRLDQGDEFNEAQREAITTAIRNPNSPQQAIIRACGQASNTTLMNAIHREERGGFDTDGQSHNGRIDSGSRKFENLTLKQRATVDWLARYPGGMDALTTKNVAKHIDQVQGVPLHWSSVYGVRDKFPNLIGVRRQKLKDRGETEQLDGDEFETATSDPDKSVRPVLEEAGITNLPDFNLDGLPTTEDQRQKAIENSAKVRHVDGAVDTDDASDDTATADDSGPPPVQSDPSTEVKRGSATYKGPETGLDLTGGAGEPSVLVERAADDAEGNAADALAELREEVGEFGEDAMNRDVEVEDMDDLEHELRVLHILVASQGQQLKAFKRALDNLTVDVSVGYEVADDE